MKKVWGTFLAFCMIGAACAPTAETPASARLTQMCDAICTKRASCEKGFEAAACNKRCTTYEAMRKIEGFRVEARDPMLDCLAKNACDADMGATANRCVSEVAKTMPPSDKAKSLCAKLEPQFRDCNRTWEVPCRDALTLIDPADLGAFDDCVDRQCKGGLVCFRETEHTVLTKRASSQ